MFIPDIAAGLVSIRYGFKGPNFATVSACASSAHAIGESFNIIRQGHADVMITGGAEASITGLTMHLTLPLAASVLAATTVMCILSGLLAISKLLSLDPAELF